MTRITILTISLLLPSILAAYRPGEKCIGAPNHPAIPYLHPPCTPGYSCSGPSPDGWGITCVADASSGDAFPQHILRYENRPGYVGCSSNADCPSGTTCNQQMESFYVSAGVTACSQYTRAKGQTCDSSGRERLPSPGCDQSKNLLCGNRRDKLHEPAVCMENVGEGGACGGDFQWCLVFQKGSALLQCVKGACQKIKYPEWCVNGRCQGGARCEQRNGANICIFRGWEGAFCDAKDSRGAPKPYECHEGFWCKKDPSYSPNDTAGLCVRA